ncbi:beta-ketoacyl-[acyl-carrier-protein] synthase family protein [Photorhabdus caribbeanensis]|nr:beta-ketoacyl-[acyl-carrier-protein] synthase family protein [Photorhabdus caribbeanensis]
MVINMQRAQRVVITGMGAVTPIGEDVESCWQSIIEKQHRFHKIEFPDSFINSRFFSFLAPNPSRYQLLPKKLTHTLSDCGKAALKATYQALTQAFGVNISPIEYYDKYECGVILGSGWGAIDNAGDYAYQYKKAKLAHPMSNLITMPSAMTATCSIMYGLRGYQNTIAAACATGTMAIGDAFEIIRSGRAKCMIAGASESLTRECNIWSIDVLNALSKEQTDPNLACCPFSLDRSGFVLAEGAAVVCLEDYNSAVERGATILAEIKGYAQYSDATNLTRPTEDIEPKILAMTKAIEQAQISPEDIDYINAHGTSTQLNDLYETQSIKAALGQHAYQVPISSTKSYTGHLIAAAGSFETIVCVKALTENCLPATLNLHRADPDCDLNYLPNQHCYTAQPEVALNISSGFGGHNAALVISKVG